uniref:Protein N-terminal asparagine amidohydrolase n=1 Tax=Kalanchoe fedtschenkoi TaxID=63787 RepID=A0A7N0T2X2_KALFE
MIFVDGVPIPSSASSSSFQEGTATALVSLMAHPDLVSASDNFKSTPERKISNSEVDGPKPRKYVYVFQREYATVDPALVDFVGTDEATTCVGVAIRNSRNGRTSVSHMDSPNVVDAGIRQMLFLLDTNDDVSEFDVHLVGGYEDVCYKQRHGTRSASHGKTDGFSFPLCSKIIETLQKNHRRFNIRTLFILHHNTRSDPDGNRRPIFNGFVVETKSGSIVPASFCRSMRCPDNIVRGVRVSSSYEDPNWEGKLLETYDTLSDRFVIASCIWTSRQVKYSMILQDLPDSEILRTCSTSPSAEGPDFVETLRRQWKYLIQNPDWRGTFPNKKSRVFKRSPEGSWVRCAE